MKFLQIAALVFFALLSGHASANDEKSEDRKVTYKQKTEIEFEGLEVEGVLLKPQSALILERKRSNFNPLVKLRTDWLEEIDQSVDEIK